MFQPEKSKTRHSFASNEENKEKIAATPQVRKNLEKWPRRPNFGGLAGLMLSGGTGGVSGLSGQVPHEVFSQENPITDLD